MTDPQLLLAMDKATDIYLKLEDLKAQYESIMQLIAERLEEESNESG